MDVTILLVDILLVMKLPLITSAEVPSSTPGNGSGFFSF